MFENANRLGRLTRDTNCNRTKHLTEATKSPQAQVSAIFITKLLTSFLHIELVTSRNLPVRCSVRCRLTMLHDRNFQLQSEQKHFVFGIIPFKKQKAGDTYAGCKTKPFAVKQINKMKHHALYVRLVAQFSQHDEDPFLP